MPLTLQEPRKKESSRLGSQRISQQINRTESKTGLTVDSDADSHEDSSETEDDEDLNAPDPEKKKLTEITNFHREIMALCRKTRDSKASKMRPNFNKGGQALETFKLQYRDTIDASGDDNKTLLHHLAKSMTKSLLPLLQWLLKTYPDLILRIDSEDHTALYTAIASQNASFVKEVCEHSTNKVEALQQSGVDGTCLHKALEMRSSIPSIMEVVDQMIKVLGNDQDVQRQGDGKGSSPLRNVLLKRNKEGNTPLHIALTTLASVTLSETIFRSLVTLIVEITQEHPRIMYERNKKSKSPYDCLGPAKETEACAGLLEELMKGIMRNSSHDEAINLLYTDSGSELSIFFDISQFAGRTIPVSELDGWETHLRFEKILQHVDLPKLRISGGDELLDNPMSDSEIKSSVYTLRSRLDFVKVFNWLRKKGGVRKVLEANVEDDEAEPHCDEAIEMALQGLDVEILDWKKLDLCSDVLWNAARGVRELVLYSSANNDVLRSWSAPDGLGRLPNLEKVHLSIREGNTTGMRIAKYREEFKSNLKKTCPRVVVLEKEALWNKHANEPSSHGPFDTASRHPWLDCMYNFAMTVRNNHRHFQNIASEVKVGIIDDGIDDRLAIFRDRIAAGKSFLKRPDRPDRTIDYWIFPYARLYIIRLNEGEGEKGERQIKIESAIKAVDWAVQNSVHIISMSWSIHSSDVDIIERQDLEKSIKKAYDKNITMFCAASDHGRNTESAAEDDLPAAFIYPLKIGAARADGNAYAKIGYEKIDFYLPGHKLVLDDYQPAKGQPQSGSSLATAVATGLAALLQYCSSIANHENKTSHGLGTIRTEQAFKRLCAVPSNFPEVEKIFGDTKNLDRPNEVRERYRKIAVALQIPRVSSQGTPKQLSPVTMT